MSEEDVIKSFQENGFLSGVLSITGIIILQLVYKRKDQIGDAIVAGFEQVSLIIKYYLENERAKIKEQVREDVSGIFNYMYMVSPFRPVRVAVMHFHYEKKRKGREEVKQHMYCSMLYEATESLMPIKDIFQGIELDAQAVQYWVTETSLKGKKGLYLDNVEEMGDGDLKALLESYDILSFYNIHIVTKGSEVYTLFVAFNRVGALEEKDIARIRILAANLFKYIH